MKVRMKFATKPKTARLRKHDLWNHTKLSTTSEMNYIDPAEWEFAVPKPVAYKLSQEFRDIDL